MRLRYWVKEAVKTIGLVMIAALVYTLLMPKWDATENWRDDLNQGGIYIGCLGAFLCMGLGTSIHQLYVPLAISFGSTRKEVLWGIQCYRLLFTFSVLLVSGILCTIATKLPMWLVMPIAVGVFLVFNGMGAILGSLSNKLGKTVLVILTLVMMLLFSGGIAAAILMCHYGYILRADILLPVMLGVGILVYSLCVVYEVKTIRKFSVK